MGRRNSAVGVAYPAVLGALALILLYIASIAPTGKWGMVAVAGLLPAAAVISVGLKAGFLCWAGVTVLAFLMLPEKFCVLLFCVLFGLYPIVKSLIERIRRMWLEYLLKLAFFNAALTVIYQVMRTAVLQSLPEALKVLWLLYLAGNVVFLIYDFGFSKLIAIYIARVGRAVR